MSCAKGHVKDPSWTFDLIWKHLHENTTKAKRTHWYGNMDPNGELDDRHRVYELLVDEPNHTYPRGADATAANEVRKRSMIPWNQLHPGIIKTFKTKYACGSVMKITFEKYMGWGGGYPGEKDVRKKGFDAVAFTVRNIMSGKPVLARTADTRYGHHFVGIVGARMAPAWEFLYIDPWAGNGAPITYAGATTSFLGIIRQENGKLKYGSFDVNTVGGFVP
ncbi:MAG: hypothetical protein WD894_24515 [Pirellulales bacterium]